MEGLIEDLIRINTVQSYIMLQLLYKQDLAAMGDLILTKEGKEALQGMEKDYLKIAEQIGRVGSKYNLGKDWDKSFKGFFKVEE